MLTGSKPQIPLRKENSPSLTEIAVPVANRESIFSKSPTYLSPLLGAELWQIFFDLNQFTAFVSYHRTRKDNLRPQQSASFEHWNSNLEYRLLSYSPPDVGTKICDNNFKEALRIAGVLWINTGLWDFPLSTSLVRSMADQLVNVLMGSDFASWIERFPDILVWILVIGSCCSLGEGSRREFLLGHLQYIATLRGFESKEDIVKAMRSFIYIDGAYSSSMAVLWRDIGEEGLG